MDIFAKIETASQGTTEDVVSVFTRKVANKTLWGAFFVVLPLALLQAFANHLLMAAWLAAFCLYSLTLAIRSRKTSLKQIHLLIFVTMLALAAAYSTWINGIHGFLWGFPVMVSVVFLLKRKLAILSAFIFYLLISFAAIYSIPFDAAWRGIISLGAMVVLTITLLVLLERMQRSFTALATTDTLTGVYNRKRLDAELDKTLALFKRSGESVAVMICDIDWFKPLNDEFGHLQGDRLLIQAAATIKESVRRSDSVFRVGGEEFLVLLPNTGLAGATTTAEKLRSAFAQKPFKVKGSETSMTISVGVAELKPDEHWTDWLERADQRLYRAKDLGRNRVIAE